MNLCTPESREWFNALISWLPTVSRVAYRPSFVWSRMTAPVKFVINPLSHCRQHGRHGQHACQCGISCINASNCNLYLSMHSTPFSQIFPTADVRTFFRDYWTVYQILRLIHVCFSSFISKLVDSFC